MGYHPAFMSKQDFNDEYDYLKYEVRRLRKILAAALVPCPHCCDGRVQVDRICEDCQGRGYVPYQESESK